MDQSSSSTSMDQGQNQNQNQPGVYGGTRSGEQQQPGTAEPAGTTTAAATEVQPGYLKTEGVSLRPELGFMSFRDPAQGSDTARAAGGVGLDWNFARLVSLDPSVYTGGSTGIIYSHLGSSGSNLFGTNSSLPDVQQGSNFFMIPVDAKVGYNINDYYRVAVHGGGNVTYRSFANSIALGSDYSPTNTGSQWKMLPNVGFDIEAALAKNVTLALRPDVTFSTGDNFFTGMVAVGIGMG